MMTGVGTGLDPVFRVVMAYDDFTSGKRAMNTCNFLAGQLNPGIELRSSMWKFDVLRSTKLGQMAVEDAAEADVIIVANSPGTGLPEEVKRWIEDWVPKKRGQMAVLVALLDFTDKNEGESVEAEAFLKAAAAKAKIDFLSQAIRFPGAQPPSLPGRSFLRWPRFSGEPPVNRPPPEAWGLND